MNRFQQLALVAVLGVYSSFSMATQLMEYPIQQAFNTEDFRLRLGDNVKFYFGEKPANVSGQVIAISKVRRKTMRNKEDPCAWALLSSLLKMKEEALKRNSHIVVNVASNYKDNRVLSKANYQCAVGAMAVEVALRGEILEPSAAIPAGSAYSTDSYPADSGSTIISSPVYTSDAILTPEPVVTPHGTYSQSPQPSVAPQPVPQPQPQPASAGGAVEERLRVLKQLYDAGEIDAQTYEMQKQRILNSL